jgi:hypothetical protein
VYLTTAQINAMHIEKKKIKVKEIVFKSTKGKNTNVLITLPSHYKKIKLPGLTAWVKALTSGNYRQGARALCTKVSAGKLGYCCLGVLSKTQGRLISLPLSYLKGKCRRGDGAAVASGISTYYLASDNPVFNILGARGDLPENVFVNTYSGITGKPYRYKNFKSLSSLNDDLKLSFKDIAKLLQLIYKP